MTRCKKIPPKCTNKLAAATFYKTHFWPQCTTIARLALFLFPCHSSLPICDVRPEIGSKRDIITLRRIFSFRFKFSGRCSYKVGWGKWTLIGRGRIYGICFQMDGITPGNMMQLSVRFSSAEFKNLQIFLTLMVRSKK